MAQLYLISLLFTSTRISDANELTAPSITHSFLGILRLFLGGSLPNCQGKPSNIAQSKRVKVGKQYEPVAPKHLIVQIFRSLREGL